MNSLINLCRSPCSKPPRGGQQEEEARKQQQRERRRQVHKIPAVTSFSKIPAVDSGRQGVFDRAHAIGQQVKGLHKDCIRICAVNSLRNPCAHTIGQQPVGSPAAAAAAGAAQPVRWVVPEERQRQPLSAGGGSRCRTYKDLCR